MLPAARRSWASRLEATKKIHKATYVTLEGVEQAGEEVKKLTHEAVSILLQLPGEKEFLKDLFLFLCTRRK